MKPDPVSAVMPVDARAFKSGAVGLGHYGKITLPVGSDGRLVTLQVSASLTVVKSKDMPADEREALLKALRENPARLTLQLG